MKKIALTGKRGKGKYTTVSDEDYEYLSQFTWNLDINNYPRRSYRIGDRKANKTGCIQMHKEVARRADIAVTGSFVDHKDRDKLNNQRSNLRNASRSTNGFNRVTQLGISGYRGVKRQTCSGRWQAAIGGNKNRLHLGTFDTPQEAACAYQTYVRQNSLAVPL